MKGMSLQIGIIFHNLQALGLSPAIFRCRVARRWHAKFPGLGTFDDYLYPSFFRFLGHEVTLLRLWSQFRWQAFPVNGLDGACTEPQTHPSTADWIENPLGMQIRPLPFPRSIVRVGNIIGAVAPSSQHCTSSCHINLPRFA